MFNINFFEEIEKIIFSTTNTADLVNRRHLVLETSTAAEI